VDPNDHDKHYTIVEEADVMSDACRASRRNEKKRQEDDVSPQSQLRTSIVNPLSQRKINDARKQRVTYIYTMSPGDIPDRSSVTRYFYDTPISKASTNDESEYESPFSHRSISPMRNIIPTLRTPDSHSMDSTSEDELIYIPLGPIELRNHGGNEEISLEWEEPPVQVTDISKIGRGHWIPEAAGAIKWYNGYKTATPWHDDRVNPGKNSRKAVKCKALQIIID
jgi:hypothetical protein